MTEEQFQALVTFVQNMAAHYAIRFKGGLPSPYVENELIEEARRVLVNLPDARDCIACSVGNPGVYVKDGRMVCPHRPE